MALAAGMGEEGSVKAAAGAAERSEQSGEPLQVPTGYAKKPPEAGALDKRRNLEPVPNCIALVRSGSYGAGTGPAEKEQGPQASYTGEGGDFLHPAEREEWMALKRICQ
jgi:hypothetical protein